MKVRVTKGMIIAAFLGLLMVIGVSTNARAQGRGRGHEVNGLGRKCEKFVNCHDARDGRWDNRGPRMRVSRDGYVRRYPRVNYGPGHRWREGERGRVRIMRERRDWR